MSRSAAEPPPVHDRRSSDARELISVIMVVTPPVEALDELYHEYSTVLRHAGYNFEFVVVYDRNMRRRVAPLLRLLREGVPLKLLEAAQNVGETALLRSALGHCSGSIIVTLPPQRRIEADALPPLIATVERGGSHLVVACRAPDRDPWLNRLQRRVVHALVRGVVGGDFHDLGSGVRVMRAEVLHELPLYGEFARFLPLLAQREGFVAEEVVVPQHASDRHTRVYSPGTYLRRFIDMAGVFFLIRFREKPLRFFGLFGGILTVLGTLMLVVMGIQRIMGEPLADRPLLLLAVLLAVIGLQAIALGMVGEIIVHSGARRNTSYRVFRRVDDG